MTRVLYQCPVAGKFLRFSRHVLCSIWTETLLWCLCQIYASTPWARLETQLGIVTTLRYHPFPTIPNPFPTTSMHSPTSSAMCVRPPCFEEFIHWKQQLIHQRSTTWALHSFPYWQKVNILVYKLTKNYPLLLKDQLIRFHSLANSLCRINEFETILRFPCNVLKRQRLWTWNH